LKFFIVIPLLRWTDTAFESISSALIQPGDFSVHVHIQSPDRSGRIEQAVEDWNHLLRNDKQRKLTFHIADDEGTYDAVGRAVDFAKPAEDTFMTWLGADDSLLPRTLATVQSIIGEHPQIKWLTGQVFISGADGANCSPYSWNDYRRTNLANGKNDGRNHPFIMQEGTFWSISLWHRVGGVDRTMRLAGDWDLWRKFAWHEPVYVLNFPLGKFSETPLRQSSDLAKYYREVDARISFIPEYRGPDSPTLQLGRYSTQSKWIISETGASHNAAPSLLPRFFSRPKDSWSSHQNSSGLALAHISSANTASSRW